MRRCARVFLGLVAPAIAVATISGCGGERKVTNFQPNVVAIPHALFDPSAVDKIARQASYSAWVELNVAWGPQHTLDLAVWPNQAAARRALAQYRSGGPKTHPVLDSNAWPRKLRRVERVRNITLAWYNLPSPADEKAVKRALRFGGGAKAAHEYTSLWLIPGTVIVPEASAASGPALYSARLEGGVIDDELTVAIWPSENAAEGYIDYIKDDSEWKRIRNATIDDTGSFGSSEISDADVAAIRRALH